METDNTRLVGEFLTSILSPGVIGAINVVGIIYEASNGTGVVKDSVAIEYAKSKGFAKSTWWYYVKKLRELGVLDKRWDNYVLPEPILKHYEKFKKIIESGDYCSARAEIKQLWEEANNPLSVAMVIVAINHLGLLDLLKDAKTEEAKVSVYAKAFR